MSPLARTDQKRLSFALSSLWKLMPGLAGLSFRSNAVVFTAFCSSPLRRARLSVNVSAIRNSMVNSLTPPHPEERRRRRRVSKDAPEHTNGASFWIILRHAMLRIAAQDEGWRDGFALTVQRFAPLSVMPPSTQSLPQMAKFEESGALFFASNRRFGSP